MRECGANLTSLVEGWADTCIGQFLKINILLTIAKT